MAEVALHKQFSGQARLTRLLLWRVGNSTDLDECLAAARDQGMLDADDEAFVRACLDLEERNREDIGALEPLVDKDMVRRLFRCADILNRADSA